MYACEAEFLVELLTTIKGVRKQMGIGFSTKKQTSTVEWVSDRREIPREQAYDNVV